jgi:hypothetical protein
LEDQRVGERDARQVRLKKNFLFFFLPSLFFRDTVHDACFLQNETWYALAQNKYVHIYDKNNVELHILKDHWQSTLLDFLPYHWLLGKKQEVIFSFCFSFFF